MQSNRGELEYKVAVNLLRAREILQSAVTQLVRDWKLTPQQYNVLRVIYEQQNQGGIPSQKIIGRLVTRVPDITRLLDRLQKAKLIERVRSESDRRVVRAKLTDRGVQLVESIAAPLAEHHCRWLGHMSSEDIHTLNELLLKLCSSPALAPSVTKPKKT